MKQHHPEVSIQGRAPVGRLIFLSTAVLIGFFAPIAAFTHSLPQNQNAAFASPAPPSSQLPEVAPTAPEPTPAKPATSETEKPASNFRIQPVEGKIRVKVTNKTQIPIVYGLLGENPREILQKGTAATLEELPIPTTITFYPQGKEFIKIQSQISAEEPGVLEVTLVETKDANTNRHALVVHGTGLFFTE